MASTSKRVRVLTSRGGLEPATLDLALEDKTAYLRYPEAEPSASPEPHSPLIGHTVIPGLIDIHVHGGFGIRFGSPTQAESELEAALLADLQTYSAAVARTGVCGFLCSIAAPDLQQLRKLVTAYAKVLDQGPFAGAKPLGLHLEGPFLNREKKGAFDPAWLQQPNAHEVARILEDGQGWIRQMTLAPELPGTDAVVALLEDAGVIPALGHSNADYETATTALRHGFRHVTHTFNAQRGFHHRDPGVVGAVLTSEGITAELIADLIHVHPGAIKLLLRCLGPDRIILITDAMAAAGLGDGTYGLVGREVTVRDGAARLADGTLAGSTATMDQCLRNMVNIVGTPLIDAVRMAAYNPARLLGLSGHPDDDLREGCPATFAVLDPSLRVVLTVIDGKIVHQALH